MKITAVGANRQVYRHTVVDTEVREAESKAGKTEFRLLSKMDPGISSGQYTLTFELSNEEIFKLFEVALAGENRDEIKGLKHSLSVLKGQIESLKTQLKRIR